MTPTPQADHTIYEMQRKLAATLAEGVLLTGKRRSALAAMRWAEIKDGVWTPPQDPRRRPGNKRVHPTPLCGLAQRVLKGVPHVEDNPFVFVGRHKGKALYPGSDLQEAIVELSGVKGFYFHAARHTVETRMAELRVPPHIRDLALDHAPMRGAGKGYDHHAYVTEVRDAFETWARALETLVARAGVRVLR